MTALVFERDTLCGVCRGPGVVAVGHGGDLVRVTRSMALLYLAGRRKRDARGLTMVLCVGCQGKGFTYGR